jgi:hypothetical protein
MTLGFEGYCDWKGSAGIVFIARIVCIVRSADASGIPEITKDTPKNTCKVTESI